MITLGIVAIAFGLQWLLWPIIDPAPFILFYPAVILASLYGEGLSAIFLSALIAQFFFVPPMYSFAIHWPGDGVRQALFIASAFMIRYLTRALSTAVIHAQEEKRTAHEERNRAKEAEEWLSTTLLSIGDAVIATDREGRVTFMNSIAEGLTEWPLAEAKGKSLPDVFRIINQHTRETAENPVAKVLKEGSTVGLANHTVVVGRNGKEAAIEDSAAPIRVSQGGTIQGVVLVFRDITEKYAQESRLAETFRKLQQSEERIKSVLENALDAVVGMNAEGLITYWNPQAEKVFGYAQAEVLDKKISETIIPYQYREAHERGMKHYLATGEGPVLNRRIEITALRRDGSEFPIELSITPIPTSGATAFSAFIRDLTEKKRAEEISRENEGQFRSLANSMTQLAWMANADGWIDWYNDRWYEYTGTNLEEMLGWGWEKVHHPDHIERVVSFVKEAWKRSEPWELTFPLKGESGEWRWFLTRGVPIVDSAGKVTRWFGTNTDIENERRTLSEISRREEQLRTVLEVLPVGVGISEPSGRITHMNQKTKDIWGGDLPLEKWGDYSEFKGSWSETGQRLKGDEWALARAIREKRTILGDVIHIECFDGTKKTVLLSAAPILGTDQQEVVGGVYVLQDITDLKKSEQDLREAVKARDEFLSIASHELKTPLTSLTLQAQLRKRQLAKGQISAFTPEALGRLLELDLKQLARVNRLIEDMLDVARIRTGKLEIKKDRFDLCELTREVVERFRPQSSNSTVEITVSTCTPAFVEADSFRIEQVLTNLLKNAIKYGQGKPIKVKIETNQQRRAFLHVVDQGMGIIPADQERIFSRFERAVSPSEVSGLGLGLAIARDIVIAHGGGIWVKSEIEKGSTFTVELPMIDEGTGS